MVTRDIVQRLLAILNETRSRVNTLESREVALLTATQTLTNKTLTTPVIGSFTNAQHAHTDAASGGTIAHTSLTGLTTGDPHTQYILKSAYDANTILAATNDDTPLALTVGASTIVGRGPTGGIAALSAGDARTVLGLATTDTVQFAKIGVGIAPNFNLIFTTESSSVKSWLGGLGSDVYDAVAGFQFAGTTSQAEFLGIRSRGTIASPTATQSGDSLFMLSGKGYQGAAYTARRAYIRIVAEDNYSSGAQGAGFAFATTAAGGTTRSEKIVFTGAGSIGVNTTSPTISDGVGVDINGKILRLRTSKTPSSASDTGNVGEICWDSGAIYVCVATNTWKKATIATW